MAAAALPLLIATTRDIAQTTFAAVGAPGHAANSAGDTDWNKERRLKPFMGSKLPANRRQFLKRGVLIAGAAGGGAALARTSLAAFASVNEERGGDPTQGDVAAADRARRELS